MWNKRIYIFRGSLSHRWHRQSGTQRPCIPYNSPLHAPMIFHTMLSIFCSYENVKPSLDASMLIIVEREGRCHQSQESYHINISSQRFYSFACNTLRGGLLPLLPLLLADWRGEKVHAHMELKNKQVRVSNKWECVRQIDFSSIVLASNSLEVWPG